MIRRWLKAGVSTLAKLRCQQKALNVQFEEIILSFLRPQHSVLDAGCGKMTRVAAKGKCQTVVGIDRDERISNNPGVDSLVFGDLSRLPFPDKTFDVVMSWTVVEHLDNPQQVFAEFSRVCKPGALVVLATPNLLHYAIFMTALTPYSFQKWFVRHVLGCAGEVFPTRYKANTPKKLAKMMENEGFTTVEMRCIDIGPVYLQWLTPAYAAGLIYHRLVNRFDKLSPFRANLIGVFRR